MAEMEMIKKFAEQIMLVPGKMGLVNTWLWDRTQRIVRNIETIYQLPEIAGANIAIDKFCLTASAYFADAGFTNYIGIETVEAGLVLADINTRDLREFSTQIVSEHLSEILDQSKISKINKIIIESNNPLAEMHEAVILSDGRNLEDVGVIEIFNEFCACGVHGRGVGEQLESWKKKKDYKYWDARLKESFHFDSIRKVAAQRYNQAERLMTQLAIEDSGKDLKEVTIESIT
jgi:hypothetical protein